MSDSDIVEHRHDVAIVGGGQAGLSLSHFLSRAGIDHAVLERDRAFSAWHGRWDSFRMNTANWMNQLAGCDARFAPDQRWYDIADRKAVLNYLDRYLAGGSFPIREGVNVHRVTESDDGWKCETTAGVFHVRAVVACTGIASHPKIPTFANDLPSQTLQLHSSQFRNAHQIEARNVMVVGSGSSGIQICEDLVRSNRFENVWLATSGNKVLPWRVAGIPIGVLSRITGVFNVRRGSLLWKRLGFDPSRGDIAMAPSPEALAKQFGVRLTERIEGQNDNHLVAKCGNKIPLDDLQIIWCTGFRPRYDWIQIERRSDVFDDERPLLGQPRHQRGVTARKGLYFLGLKFQHSVGSHLLYGVGRDAEYLAGKIADQLSGNRDER